MTEKQLFFTKLHGKLAKELKITTNQVSTIRSLILGETKTLEEVIEWAEGRLKQSRFKPNSHTRVRREPKIYYQQIINFLNSVKKADWEKLLQITEYDKKT